MTQTVTFDDVWKMFQETNLQFKEIALEFKEIALESKEIARRFKETDLKFKEIALESKETARRFKETDRLIGRLGGRLGEFVEGFVAPACKTLFAERGIPIHFVSRRVEAGLPNNRHMEIDLLVVNTDTVALVEVKSKLTVDDVKEHLQRLSEFKEFFPAHTDKKAIGAVAGMVVEENVINFAIKKGLFVIVQTGDSVRVANDATFNPHIW